MDFIPSFWFDIARSRNILPVDCNLGILPVDGNLRILFVPLLYLLFVCGKKTNGLKDVHCEWTNSFF